MKKFVIGLGVLGTFVVYSLGIRHQVPTISKPSSIASGGSAARTQSAAPPASASSNQNIGSSTGSNTQGSSTNSTGQYKDGTYTGSTADAYYGNVQVQAVVSGGKLTNVKVLQYPNTHSTSVIINQQALPYLKQEAVQAQGANIQIISGATFTSQAFAQSLSAALSKA